MSFLWALYLAVLLKSSAQHRNQAASSYSSHLIGTSLRTGVVKSLDERYCAVIVCLSITSKEDISFWLSSSAYSLISCLYSFWLVQNNWFHKPLSSGCFMLYCMSPHVRGNRNIDILLIIVMITGTVRSLEVTNKEVRRVCLHSSRVKPPRD